MRRSSLLRPAALALLLSALLSALSALLPTSAGAGEEAAPRQASTSEELVEVVEVSGLLDPVLVDFVERRIEDANERGLTALVLRLNSPGAVVSDAEVIELADQISSSEVPIAIWVGPAKAQARGAAAQLVAIAQPAGIAPGAVVGRTGEQILPVDRYGVLFGEDANRLRDSSIRYDAVKLEPGETAPEPVEIRAAGLVPADSIGDFIINLEGVATREVTIDGVRQRQPVTAVRFVQLTLGSELLHTVASPSVAYLLFVIGIGLIIFELFTAGIGLAGLCGAGFLALGCYGLGVLPVRWWAVGLLLVSFGLFMADVQVAVPRIATWAGTVLFVVATYSLYRGITLSWVTVVSAVVLLLVVYLRGMPAMVRTRFSTTDIGRDWLVGEEGVITSTGPIGGGSSSTGESSRAAGGTVAVRSAQWPARVVSGDLLTVGDRVLVTGASGLVLDVEPITAR